MIEINGVCFLDVTPYQTDLVEEIKASIEETVKCFQDRPERRRQAFWAAIEALQQADSDGGIRHDLMTENPAGALGQRLWSATQAQLRKAAAQEVRDIRNSRPRRPEGFTRLCADD